jgi:hypothetical protein
MITFLTSRPIAEYTMIGENLKTKKLSYYVRILQ